MTTRTRSHHLLFALLAALLLLAPLGSAWAQGRPGPAPAAAVGKVDVKLLVVAASDSHAGIDPRLKPLQRHLQFLRYQGYELLDTHSASLAPGGEASFTIVGNRRVSVALKSRTAERAQFRIQIFSQGKKLLDTTLSVNRNGTFIVAGPRYQDGILILPLQARY
ncbi:MAG: hypothetical protein ABIO70_13310 [Pseudomonadota bacterium]